MEEIEIDPWIKTKFDAYDTYRVVSIPLYTIPFVISENLTLKRSTEKYFEECRMIPEIYETILKEKEPSMITLESPTKLSDKMNIYLKGSSSQHMSTILDGIDNGCITLDGVDILVASDTLHKIAGAVFQQTQSWKLRAHLETIQRKKIIILCDDDLEEIELVDLRSFATERHEAISFAQSLCEQNKNKKANPYLHVSKLVLSTVQHGDSIVRLAVVGEVDMDYKEKSVNTAVMTGRVQRINLGKNEESISNSFEYVWSRCFWMGIKNCIIGMRSEYNESVKTIHRFDLQEYHHHSRKRFDRLPDVATTCVAQVLNRLQEAVYSRPHENWIVEYEGRDEELEPANIKITIAADTRSFLLVREHFKMIKDQHVTRKTEEAAKLMKKKMKPTKRVYVQTQKHRHSLAKIRENATELLGKQLHKLLNSVNF
uniref:tRNA pseudouridine(55) synthase n=1 Tax=Caenorhabditis tropicalis TaxID=1561998 RepID=A0A1I7T230_9PELO